MIIYLFNHAAQLQKCNTAERGNSLSSTTILQSTCTTSSMPLSLFCPLFHGSPEWLCCGTNQVVVGTGNLWHCWLLQQCRWIHLGQNRNAEEIQWMPLHFPHNIQHPLILLEADRAVPLRLESHPCSPRLPKCKCTFDNSILNNGESAVLADMAKVIDSGGSLDTEDTNDSQLYQGCKESDKAYHCGFLSVRKINRWLFAFIIEKIFQKQLLCKLLFMKYPLHSLVFKKILDIWLM